jgi:hypothetical protein
LFESKDALLHGLRVIVSPSTGLGPFSHAVNEGLCGAVEVNQVPDNNLISQLLLKHIPILLISGEAVKQIPAVAVGGDTFFNQLDHQLRRNEFTLLHEAIDGLGQVASLLLLLPQEISRGEMLELVISNQVVSLSALATAGSAQQEVDVWLGECPEAVHLTLNAQGST